MTRLTLFAGSFIATAMPAFAHPGHLAQSGGHSHWIAAAAAALAIVVALGAFVRYRVKR